MKQGTEFELFCKELLDQLNVEGKLNNIYEISEHDVDIVGDADTKNQIDIYMETQNDKKLIVECKDYKSNVSKDKIATLDSIKNDIHAEGILIAKVGFQSGAIKYAMAKGIDLMTAKKIDDPIFNERVKLIEMNISVITPDIMLNIVEPSNDMSQLNLLESDAESQCYLIIDTRKESLFEIIKKIRSEWSLDSSENYEISLKEKFSIEDKVCIRINETTHQMKDLKVIISKNFSTTITSIKAEDVVKGIVTLVHENREIIVRK